MHVETLKWIMHIFKKAKEYSVHTEIISAVTSFPLLI